MAHTHEIMDSDKSFIIDPITRTISNNSDKVKLVQFDHDSERFTFQCPRLIEGHDMSSSTSVRVQYININKKTKETSVGVYLVEDLAVSSDNSDTVIFSWLISRNATKYAGTLSFLIEFTCTDENAEIIYAWHTDIYRYITISTGMDNGEVIEEKYPDILEKWKDEILAEIPIVDPHPITRIESLDKTNMVILRNLDSGTYVLYGYFKPHEGSSSTMMFSSNILVSIVKNTSESHVQIFYPNDNCVQYVKITDTSYERKNIYLSDLADSVAEIGDLNDLTTEAKDKLVTAINEVFAYNNYILNGKTGASVRTISAASEDEKYSLGQCAFAEGSGTKASGPCSHAEGAGATASGTYSHSEGSGTTASGQSSHAEGGGSIASGPLSHAEGNTTTASGSLSHAEGSETKASGQASHAEGSGTTATGSSSHAEGWGTIAYDDSSHAQGCYNIPSNSDYKLHYAHTVGNGTSDTKRSNAHALDWNGNAWFAGDVYIKSTSGTDLDSGSKKLATEEYVDSKATIPDWTQNDTTAKDYIKNRPGAYSVPSDTAKTKLGVGVPIGEENGMCTGYLSALCEIVEGDTYSVAVDNEDPVEYTAVLESGIAVIESTTIAELQGGADGWAIAIMDPEYPIPYIIASQAYQDKKFTVYRKEAQEYVKIPQKYLDGATTVVTLTYGPGHTEDNPKYIADMTSSEIADAWEDGKNRVILFDNIGCISAGTFELEVAGDNHAYFYGIHEEYIGSVLQRKVYFVQIYSDGTVDFGVDTLAPDTNESNEGRLLQSYGKMGTIWVKDQSVKYVTQTLTDAQQSQARSNISAIDASLGITTATVGQIPKVSAVDSKGIPTKWEVADVESSPITKIESLDKTNVKALRGLADGNYILRGYFVPYENADSTIILSSDRFAAVVNGKTDTHVQILYPYNNCIRHLKITDTAYENTYVYLNDLLGSVGDLTILTTNAKDTLVNAINETASAIPTVTAADNGKFLQVVDGAWAATAIPNAEEASF